MRTENDYEKMTDSELAVKGLFNHLKFPSVWRREAVRRIRRLHAEVIPFRLATKGAKDVLAERQRQVDELNWSAAHDDGHTGYELAKAAFCYLQWCIKPDLDREASLRASKSTGYSPYRWPFSSRWWKPRNRRSDLVRAAALCMAEIDRLDRIEDREKSEAELPAAVKFGLLFPFAGDDEEPETCRARRVASEDDDFEAVQKTELEVLPVAVSSPSGLFKGADERFRTAYRLNFLSAEVHQDNLAAGWYNNPNTGEKIDRNLGEMLALVHSEISEALEAVRKPGADKHLPHRTNEEVEIADAVIRILDYARYRGFDLGGAVQEKRAFNRNRSDHKAKARVNGGKRF